MESGPMKSKFRRSVLLNWETRAIFGRRMLSLMGLTAHAAHAQRSFLITGLISIAQMVICAILIAPAAAFQRYGI